MKSQEPASRASHVSVVYNPEKAFYSQQSPFSPQEAYPEYPFLERASEENPAYEAVRRSFQQLGYDKEHYGTAQWNPLGVFIAPGDRVVLKPNFVREAPYSGGDREALLTDGSVIRAVLDYVLIALQGKGSVTVGDAPIQTAEWGGILQASHLEEIVSFYQGKTEVAIQIKDFRTEKTDKTYGSFIWRHRPLGGPDNWTVVDLGAESLLDAPEVRQDRLRAPEYDRRLMARHHQKGKHEYLVNRCLLEADVIINLPKLKTHRIGGLTGALKNLVGILAHKSCLAHYSAGSLEDGGDEYPRRSFVKKGLAYFMGLEGSSRWLLPRALAFLPRIVFHFLSRRTDRIFEGSWYGNDTLWRMALDLNRILLYADASGRLHKQQQRKYFCLMDGIIAGEKNGPLIPSKKAVGVVVAGANPVACDYIGAQLMGFPIAKIPMVKHGFDPSIYPLTEFPPAEVKAVGLQGEAVPNLHFIPHKNWQGHVG